MEAHAAKLDTRPVTDAARQIALEFCCSIEDPELIDQVRAAYENGDSEGQSNWAYLAVLNGTDVVDIVALEPESFMVSFHQGEQAARAGETEEAKRTPKQTKYTMVKIRSRRPTLIEPANVLMPLSPAVLRKVREISWMITTNLTGSLVAVFNGTQRIVKHVQQNDRPIGA